MSVRAPRKRRPYSRKRKRIAHSSPTTSWPRTASRQDKFGAHVPFGKHAALLSAAPFPQKVLRPFRGALGELARLAVGRKKSCIHVPWQQTNPPQRKNLCGGFGRGDGICAFGGAPRCTAPRAVQFASRLCVFGLRCANCSLPFAPPPSNPVGIRLTKNRQGNSCLFFGRGDGI